MKGKFRRRPVSSSPLTFIEIFDGGTLQRKR